MPFIISAGAAVEYVNAEEVCHHKLQSSENTVAALREKRMELIRRSFQECWTTATSLTSSPGPLNGCSSCFQKEGWNSKANLYSSDGFENGAPAMKWRERGLKLMRTICCYTDVLFSIWQRKNRRDAGVCQARQFGWQSDQFLSNHVLNSSYKAKNKTKKVYFERRNSWGSCSIPFCDGACWRVFLLSLISQLDSFRDTGSQTYMLQWRFILSNKNPKREGCRNFRLVCIFVLLTAVAPVLQFCCVYCILCDFLPFVFSLGNLTYRFNTKVWEAEC